METTEPNFLTKVAKHSTTPVLHSDLIRMQNYKLALIDSMIYEPQLYKCGKRDKLRNDRLMFEIKDVEMWLKKNWEIFLHDNNRSLKLTA